MAENIVAVAQGAESTTQGANDTQTSPGELARMANEIQSIVGQFKYDERAQGVATSDLRPTVGPGSDSHLAGRLNSQNAQPATRIQ